MSGLFASLHQNVRALTAHSRGVETAGRNLANVNNPDYARQRVLLADRGTVITPQGPQSFGVEARSIEQIRDVLLDRQVTREQGLRSAYQAEADAYARAQSAFGENIDRTQAADGTDTSQSGLAATLGEFFNAFQALAARPTDLGERQNLVQRADLLAQRFRLTDDRLSQVQSDLSEQVSTDTTEANRLLSTIAELNGQIGSLEINYPGAATNLRDQRQALVEKLSGLIGAETRPHPTAAGQIDVFVRDASGTTLTLVSLRDVEPIAYDGTQLTTGTAATPIALAGGSTRGHLQARDGSIAELRAGLDRFAAQLATAVNGAYNPTAASGGDFFTFSSGTPAATLTLASGLTAASVRAAPVGSAASDNSTATAVAALTDRRFTTTGGDLIDGTFTQHYAALVSSLGRAVAGAEGRLEDQTQIETLVREQRQSVSGVSLDEEVADLQKYQRAFQASSRVIAVIDDLLDVVVNRLSRG